MRNVFITAAALVALSTAAFAGDATVSDPVVTAPLMATPVLSGGIGVEVAENAAGDFAATTTLSFGIDVDGLAFGSASIESIDGNTVELDSWVIGTHIGAAKLSFGKQGDLMVGNDFEIVGGDTLASVADDHESLQVAVGAATVMVGLTDITNDVTDVENVQGSYSFTAGAVALTAVADYNINSEEWVLGSKAAMDLTDNISLGGLVTYSSGTETFGYEASAGYGIATAFVNGDDADLLQNIGAGVAYDLQSNLNVYAEGAYNLDAENTIFGAGVAFKF